MSEAPKHWFLKTDEEFQAFIAGQLASGREVITLDFEADSMHRYGEQLCLVQFGDGEDFGLIDPLAIEDMNPLIELMNAKVVWMHGADYDIQLLKQTCGRVPKRIYDTQTAARFLGFTRFGYAAMVEHFFEVTLSKSSQRDDWAIRPLTEKMQDYALNDVRYMLPMAEKLEAELKAKGRWEWFLQTCDADLARGAEREGPGPDEIWRIKGSGRLDRKGLALLRALWHWRDAEAKAWDRPSFMVARNADLIEWSSAFSECGRLPEARRKWRDTRKQNFREVLEELNAMDKADYPERPHRKRRAKDSQFDAEVERMIAHRDEQAEALGLERSFIVSRSVIEALAHRETVSGVRLLPWQEDLMRPVLPEGYQG